MTQARRIPVQNRSRERLEAILAQARIFLSNQEVDDFTLNALAAQSGLSVASIYRYFSDREAVLSTLLDHEQTKINQQVAEAFVALERVTATNVMETVTRTYMAYFEDNPTIARLWFGNHGSRRIYERVRRRDEQSAQWLWRGMLGTGMLQADTPTFLIETVVRLTDRAFEHAYLVKRTPEARSRIIEEYIKMVDARIVALATIAGTEGVSPEVFLSAAGPLTDLLDSF